MVGFVDLPVELLPHIISHIVKPHYLNQLSLVNKLFHDRATPQLYERVAIYPWQRDGKTKVTQLFTTLATYPHLAEQVYRLEIREFPKAITGHDLKFVNIILLRGLRACTNLQSCIWTRDGSIPSEILSTLSACPAIRELEINGRSQTQYDPAILRQFTTLSKLSLIMPDAGIVRQLDPWLADVGGVLQNLTITCKASTAITDDLLESLSSNLAHLKQLYLTGCTKVTHKGIWSIMCKNSVGGLEGLGLQGLSTHFDMSEFSHLCVTHSALVNLLSITLTIHARNAQLWASEIPTLLSASPHLQNFHIYSTESLYPISLTPPPFITLPSSSLTSSWSDEFWSKIVSQHGRTLRRFSVHRMPVSLNAIEEVCTKCTGLRELFVSIQTPHILTLKTPLSRSPETLGSLHINTPYLGERHLTPAEALEIVEGCSAPLSQIGCNTRVWQVSRRIEQDSTGELRAYREILPYENPSIPEAFLIVRT